MSPPQATAVVVTHNSEAHLFTSLTALCQAELSVRVVDNASVDGTLGLLEREFPDVKVFANPVNVGFAAAVNQVLSTVDSDVVLLVDPDCVLPPGSAHELIRTVRGRSEVGIAGPRLIGPDGRVAISAHPFETLAGVLASRFGGNLAPVAVRRLLCGARRRSAYDACRRTGEGSGATVAVDWLWGACLAVRTDLLTAIGGLDEAYFLYYEDEELCLRARQHGAEVVYVPAACAYHVGGGSSSDRTVTWPHLYRGLLLFFERHRRRQLPAVRAAVLLRALVGTAAGVARLALTPAGGAARIRAWSQIARTQTTRQATAPQATSAQTTAPQATTAQATTAHRNLNRTRRARRTERR